MTQQELLGALRDEGLKRDDRTLRRWLEVLREAGFDLRRSRPGAEILGSPRLREEFISFLKETMNEYG